MEKTPEQIYEETMEKTPEQIYEEERAQVRKRIITELVKQFHQMEQLYWFDDLNEAFEKYKLDRLGLL